MIDEQLARQAIGLLGTAAAILVEDAHLQLVSTPGDMDAARAIASTLHRLGAELEALGRAAQALARSDSTPVT